jgi:hypothetical protein
MKTTKLQQLRKIDINNVDKNNDQALKKLKVTMASITKASISNVESCCRTCYWSQGCKSYVFAGANGPCLLKDTKADLTSNEGRTLLAGLQQSKPNIDKQRS